MGRRMAGGLRLGQGTGSAGVGSWTQAARCLRLGASGLERWPLLLGLSKLLGLLFLPLTRPRFLVPLLLLALLLLLLQPIQSLELGRGKNRPSADLVIFCFGLLSGHRWKWFPDSSWHVLDDMAIHYHIQELWPCSVRIEYW